ncbi:putative G protein-regulated inducer of neurite outgrowth 1 [Scophthalmus maximus]|uniref:Putative G protein-regulated inducer of neurite outgrowth 1 n=1 Tax=Scophthalmus maximus TaxID=52904 RepID=A0A2U9C7B7_SCOMX|nr:putative G protein-regulated inducer of neurite outgrowth 1 [Scophthalmus maximus]
MGSVKDEMRGLREDHQPHESTDDAERPGGSDGSSVPEAPQTNTSQESTTQGDRQPRLHMNASYSEEGGKSPISKDQALSGENSDNPDCMQVKDCTQADTSPLPQQPEADKTAAAAHKHMPISNKFLNNGAADAEVQRETSEDKSMSPDREKEPEAESVLVPVPSTSDPSNPRSPDPRSPAPFGLHHMRTQVSLEVVQCRSAATSPMTPPEGGHPVFFPSSFGGTGAVGSDTKDAELQVGQLLEFCSVATSPMTPKTPSATAFPELIGRETVQKGEQVKRREEQREGGQRESFPATRSLAGAESETTGAWKMTEGFSSNASSESSAGCTAAEVMEPQVRLEDCNRQCKQQRMGSMDQDITILVTHYGNNEEEEEGNTELSFYSVEPEMVKIDEFKELGENRSDEKRRDGKESLPTENAAPDQAHYTNPPQNKTVGSSVPASQSLTNIKSDSSEGGGDKDACEESTDVSLTKPHIPESPAPFGCHNIRTQVSLEVVQCQSVATSPMTPPDGDHAFYFPSSYGGCGTVGAEAKDAELQAGQQVEFRSVATAPMTPRTPTTTAFPEIKREASTKEKIVEEAEAKNEQVEEDKEEVPGDEEKAAEEKKVEGAAEEDETEAINLKEKCEEKCEEPVQEVSWDEKGMTWEVYGAVVEVAVLGSVIQKHLEKQVKKQKKQPSMPPPPPLNLSATPLLAEPAQGGSGPGKCRAGKRGERDGKVGRRRRNPFRLLMENVQQPHCCSRAHTTE